MDLDDRIRRLENQLAANPNDLSALKRLVSLLDDNQTNAGQLGAFNNAQAAIGASLDEGWQQSLLDQENIIAAYPDWLGLLQSAGVQSAVPIAQAFAGQVLRVNGVFGRCNKRLDFFNETGAISAVCHGCYKVQILAANLAALFQTHFLLLNLDLPRDNTRKCMIEVREGIKFPYKAYIYCENIDEVKKCLEIFRETQQKLGVKDVISKITHGCSEFGLKYPEFRYSDDDQVAFAVPETWGGMEEKYFANFEFSDPTRENHNKPFISLRDVFAFCTWVKYAELIGDKTSKKFASRYAPNLPRPFVNRVTKQAQIRNRELDELGAMFDGLRGQS